MSPRPRFPPPCGCLARSVCVCRNVRRARFGFFLEGRECYEERLEGKTDNKSMTLRKSSKVEGKSTSFSYFFYMGFWNLKKKEGKDNGHLDKLFVDRVRRRNTRSRLPL